MSVKGTIAVDLDGTITLTDTLHESVLLILKNKPLMLLMFPFWLIKGIAFFKFKISEIINLDVTALPYNEPLIEWLKSERADGKKIVLCSASNENITLAVADYLQMFDDVMSSDATTNLKSVNKRKALENKFGKKGYDYVGNSRADIAVWAGSRHAILVNTNQRISNKVMKFTTVFRTFPPSNDTISEWRKALRLHQWLKNMLLFIPILAAHQIGNVQLLSKLMLAFVSFSLCASAIYIMNDLLDLESDRRHPNKQSRPFATASLSILTGVVLFHVLIVVSFTLGLMINTAFLSVLIGYFLLANMYSLALKRLVLVDCLILAILYTMRIIAGAAAIYLPLSFWLMAFSIFIFLSLALMKRYAELMMQIKAGNKHAQGRGYAVTDASLLQTLGVSAGYLSVLVIALYLRSEEVILLYTQPAAIWFSIPLLLFWISWIWLKAHRGEMHDDPIVFAIKDKTSLLIAVLIAAVFVFAATQMIT